MIHTHSGNSNDNKNSGDWLRRLVGEKCIAVPVKEMCGFVKCCFRGLRYMPAGLISACT